MASRIDESELLDASCNRVLDFDTFKGLCKYDEKVSPSDKMLLIEDNFMALFSSSDIGKEIVLDGFTKNSKAGEHINNASHTETVAVISLPKV